MYNENRKTMDKNIIISIKTILLTFLIAIGIYIVYRLGPIIGLFLFGLALNIAFIRTRSLFLPIGLHAGAVFMIKFQNSFVRKGPEIYYPFIGNTPHYDGVFEWIFLIILGLVLYRFGRSFNK